jgi:hypothetical protein
MALMPTTVRENKMNRTLDTIARDIKRDWTNPYFGAVPYLDAMHSLQSIRDRYYYDDAESVVRYFLANATTWKGDTARAIKAELKTLLKGAR